MLKVSKYHSVQVFRWNWWHCLLSFCRLFPWKFNSELFTQVRHHVWAHILNHRWKHLQNSLHQKLRKPPKLSQNSKYGKSRYHMMLSGKRLHFFIFFVQPSNTLQSKLSNSFNWLPNALILPYLDYFSNPTSSLLWNKNTAFSWKHFSIPIRISISNTTPGYL